MYPIITDQRPIECPICGHQALVIDDYDNKERVVMCCDEYCPNFGGRYDQ